MEVFSDGDEVTTDEFGLDTSAHNEYNGTNNRCDARIEHATSFTVPGHLEVLVGTQLRLPVSFATTLGRRDASGNEQNAKRRTDVLIWQPGSYQDGHGSGTLILRGDKTGVSFIRILDRRTNSYQDITVTFTEEAKGLDITNTNGLFTYFDTEGQPVTGSGGDWVFQKNITSWRNGEEPFYETLALGCVGASFQFTTEAESIALDFHGKIRVSSDIAGFEPIELSDGGEIQIISFGENPEFTPHTVTITVVEEAFPGTADKHAYFDRLIEVFAGDLVHQATGTSGGQEEATEWQSLPNSSLVWEQNFPEPSSLKAGQVYETTLYGIVNGVILKNAGTHFTYEGDNVEVLSMESAECGTYGKRFAIKVRFTGNGPVTFKLENDKGDDYAYTVNVNWWEPRASAFNKFEDAAYAFYEKKYPELPEMYFHAEPGSVAEAVDNRWMHAEPDDRGGAVKVNISDDAPAESFEIWVVDFNDYMESQRLQKGESVVVGRGESVSIPAEENSEVLVIARVASTEGGDSSLDYQIVRKDGTVERYNAEHANYFNMALVEVPEVEELIAFKTQSLVLTGQIGVNFYMNLPQIEGVDYNESYVEFTVCGDKTVAPYDANAMNAARTYYRFTRFVNAVQMADEIEAVFHYFKDGEERTLATTYSVKQYVLDFDETGGFGAKVTALVHALADYGHHAQPYLSEIRGWTIGTDHLEMDVSYKGSYSKTELSNAQKDLKNKQMSVKKMKDVLKTSCSLYLDSGTGIYLYFTMKEGYAGKVTATVDGTAVQPEKLKDGRYCVRILDIPVHKLGKEYNVRLKTKAGTTTVKVSALSYAQAVLKNTENEKRNNIMLALYRYYKAAEALLRSGN